MGTLSIIIKNCKRINIDIIGNATEFNGIVQRNE